MTKILILLLFIVGCNQQKVVDGTTQKEQLDSIGSQLQFSLDPSVSYSTNTSTTLVALNTQTGTKLSIYSDSQCENELETKTVLGKVTRFNFNFSGDQTIVFYFRVVDIDFKKSGCLYTKAFYTIDNMPPLGPLSVSTSQSVGINPRPSFSIFGIESGDKLTLFSDLTCSFKLGQINANGSSALLIPTKDLPDDGQYDFYYRIEDRAGNIKTQMGSTCLSAASSYLYDTTAPSLPSSIAFNGNDAIDRETIIDLDFQNSESDLEVRLYTNSSCTIGGFTSGYSVTNNLSVSFNFSTFISDRSYTLYYKIRDRAGNYLFQNNSNCINSNLTYYYDIGAPQTPVLTNKTKKSALVGGVPTLVNYPPIGERKELTIEGSGLEVGTTVQIFPYTSCSGAPLLTAQVTDDTENFNISLPNGDNYQLSAKLEDTAGNISSCSNQIEYEYKEVKQIALGLHHSCVHFYDGETYCFGRNHKGQLGLGTVSNFEKTPKKVSLPIDTQSVSTGLNHTCHLDTSGDVWCSGDNKFSQVGLPQTTTNIYSTPTLTESGQNFTFLTSGDNHNCGINSLGNLLCFGSNSHGQVGDLAFGTNIEAAQTGQLGPLTNIVDISLGGAHSCVTNSTGSISCFGQNFSGQSGSDFGNPNNQFYADPVTVPTFESTQLSLGTNTSCFIQETTSQVLCFGDGQKNKLGDATQIDSFTPKQIADSSSFSTVSSGNDKTCITNTDNEVFCFGNGQNGVEKIMTNLKFENYHVGHSHDCGISKTGEVFCRGSNNFGQLGTPLSSSSTDFSIVDFAFDQASILFLDAPLVSINTQSTPLEFDNDLGVYNSKTITIRIKNNGDGEALNIETNILSLSEFTITSDTCSPSLSSLASCEIDLIYTPTQSYPNGKDYTLNMTYNDVVGAKQSAINFRAYSIRALKDLDFTLGGNPISSVIEFNDNSSPLSANQAETLSRLLTIQNNSTVNMQIEQASFFGDDGVHFSYSGGFPGQNGTCSGVIPPGESCLIDITYSPKLASMTPPDSSHQSSLRLLIRQGQLLTNSDLALKGFAVMQSPQINAYSDNALISTLFNLNNFGSAIVAITSATLQGEITFKNEGTEKAVISSMTTVDSLAQFNILSNTCQNSLVLDINESCSVVVQYDPTVVSPITGHLFIIPLVYNNQALPLDPQRTTTVEVKAFARSP